MITPIRLGTAISIRLQNMLSMMTSQSPRALWVAMVGPDVRKRTSLVRPSAPQGHGRLRVTQA